MRINRYIALATGMSRRAVDDIIRAGQVTINDAPATLGQETSQNDIVRLDGQPLALPDRPTTIMINKPAGYVCSRDGQGNKTIYNLLPLELHKLKPVGRLDKDSSGVLLLTNDGELANELTHPSFVKTKVYEVTLNKALSDHDKQHIEKGVKLKDGVSKLGLQGQGKNWTVTMHEGRNRQIRRTFAALNYEVGKLHRTQLGSYSLDTLALGKYHIL